MRLRKLHLVALLALGGIGYWGWQHYGQPAPVAAPLVAEVRRGDVAQTVLASGTLEAARLVSVGARVSGQIETLAVALGDVVKAGDLIAQIDSQDQQNAVLQAEAALAAIDAQIAARQAVLQRAELVLERQKALNENRHVAREAVESAEADVKVYHAEIDQLRAQRVSAEVNVGTARNALERTRITAPIDGTVVAVLVREGQSLVASQQAPTLVKLADLETMLVKTEISEADVMNVRPGQNVTFTTLGGGRPFRAKVREIEPAPTEIETSDTISSSNAIYYNGLLEVANPEGKLRIGMTAQVQIELGRADGVLLVPASALRRERGKTHVMVWDGQSSQRREVVAGLDDKVMVEIREGLSEGEKVETGTQANAGRSGAPRMAGPGGPGGMRF